MRQPQPPDTIEQLRDFLSFAVPLRAADLAYKIKLWGYSRDQAVAWLTGEASRAGQVLGAQGDAVQFSDGRPRIGKAQARVVGTADEIATGIAAASLLAQLDGREGVSAFGDFYGPRPRPAAAG